MTQSAFHGVFPYLVSPLDAAPLPLEGVEDVRGALQAIGALA